MKQLKKQILTLMLLCTLCGCESACENCDDTTYYNTIGGGYVMFYDDDGNLQPKKGAKITVRIDLGYGGGLFSNSSPDETFYTDETGKYQIRFIARTRCRDVVKYSCLSAGGWRTKIWIKLWIFWWLE